MADKGFVTENECLSYNLTIWAYQMVPSELIKTKRITNKSILVEQVIRQIKTFKIFANEFPISLTRHIDNILIICCALVSLKPRVFRDLLFKPSVPI